MIDLLTILRILNIINAVVLILLSLSLGYRTLKSKPANVQVRNTRNVLLGLFFAIIAISGFALLIGIFKIVGVQDSYALSVASNFQGWVIGLIFISVVFSLHLISRDRL